MKQPPLVWLDYHMDTGGSGKILEVFRSCGKESNGSVHVLATVRH